jgi:hypothetical protein
MKTIRCYDLKIDGEIDDTVLFVNEESVRNINKINGTDLHIRKRKDIEKIMNFYFEDFEEVEYKYELITK